MLEAESRKGHCSPTHPWNFPPCSQEPRSQDTERGLGLGSRWWLSETLEGRTAGQVLPVRWGPGLLPTPLPGEPSQRQAGAEIN